MARARDSAAEVDSALAIAEEQGLAERGEPGYKEVHAARRVKALSLRLAGMTYEQIAQEVGVSKRTAWELVQGALEIPQNPKVDELRAVENARLDRVQVAIWREVLSGNLAAVDRFMKISERRARLNGLDAPNKVDLSVSVRREMEEALVVLEQTILETPTAQIEAAEYAEVLEEEVLHDDPDPEDGDGDNAS